LTQNVNLLIRFTPKGDGSYKENFCHFGTQYYSRDRPDDGYKTVAETCS